MQSLQKDEEQTRKEEIILKLSSLVSGMSWHDLLQIWYVDSPSSGHLCS